MAEPRIVLWDIETVQNLVATFTLWERSGLSLPHRNVLQERYIVCASWKDLNEKRVHSVSVLDDPKRYRKNPFDDQHVVETLHEVLAEADVIVAHNGDQYDTKFTEGRILYHGLSPLPPLTKIDTKTVAKNRFNLNSNRLDYLGLYLGVGKKKEIDPQRWLDILSQGPKAVEAIREMVRYNKQDILLLEKVFHKLRPYVPNHVNRQLFGEFEGCPRCGSRKVQSRQGREYHRTTTRVYPKFQCQECGGWFRDKTFIKDVNRGVTKRVL